MLFVMSRDKIVSYIIAMLVVVILLGTASFIQNHDITTIQTLASINKDIPIYSVETTDKKLSLSINCAWNADDIYSILETLNKNNVKTTFFMVGDWVDKYPDAVKKIAEAGHDVANHSNTHAHVSNISYDRNVEEVKLCADKIESITGKRPYLYRGPYGEYNDTVMKAARAENHITIQWSSDTLDYTGLTGKEMWDRISKRLENGSIILMHNGTEHTADSLDMIIGNIKKEGYEIVPVSELIYKDSYIVDNAGVQHRTNNQ